MNSRAESKKRNPRRRNARDVVHSNTLVRAMQSPRYIDAVLGRRAYIPGLSSTGEQSGRLPETIRGLLPLPAHYDAQLHELDGIAKNLKNSLSNSRRQGSPPRLSLQIAAGAMHHIYGDAVPDPRAVASGKKALPLPPTFPSSLLLSKSKLFTVPKQCDSQIQVNQKAPQSKQQHSKTLRSKEDVAIVEHNATKLESSSKAHMATDSVRDSSKKTSSRLSHSGGRHGLFAGRQRSNSGFQIFPQQAPIKASPEIVAPIEDLLSHSTKRVLKKLFFANTSKTAAPVSPEGTSGLLGVLHSVERSNLPSVEQNLHLTISDNLSSNVQMATNTHDKRQNSVKLDEGIKGVLCGVQRSDAQYLHKIVSNSAEDKMFSTEQNALRGVLRHLDIEVTKKWHAGRELAQRLLKALDNSDGVRETVMKFQDETVGPKRRAQNARGISHNTANPPTEIHLPPINQLKSRKNSKALMKQRSFSDNLLVDTAISEIVEDFADNDIQGEYSAFTSHMGKEEYILRYQIPSYSISEEAAKYSQCVQRVTRLFYNTKISTSFDLLSINEEHLKIAAQETISDAKYDVHLIQSLDALVSATKVGYTPLRQSAARLLAILWRNNIPSAAGKCDFVACCCETLLYDIDDRCATVSRRWAAAVTVAFGALDRHLEKVISLAAEFVGQSQFSPSDWSSSMLIYVSKSPVHGAYNVVAQALRLLLSNASGSIREEAVRISIQILLEWRDRHQPGEWLDVVGRQKVIVADGGSHFEYISRVQQEPSTSEETQAGNHSTVEGDSETAVTREIMKDVMKMMLNDWERNVRKICADALLCLDGLPIFLEQIGDMLRSTQIVKICDALRSLAAVQLITETIWPDFLNCFSSFFINVRYEACRTAEALGLCHSLIVKELVKCMLDEEPRIRLAAIKAVGKVCCNPGTCAKVIETTIQQLTYEQDEGVRVAGVRCLSTLITYYIEKVSRIAVIPSNANSQSAAATAVSGGGTASAGANRRSSVDNAGRNEASVEIPEALESRARVLLQEVCDGQDASSSIAADVLERVFGERRSRRTNSKQDYFPPSSAGKSGSSGSLDNEAPNAAEPGQVRTQRPRSSRNSYGREQLAVLEDVRGLSRRTSILQTMLEQDKRLHKVTATSANSDTSAKILVTDDEQYKELKKILGHEKEKCSVGRFRGLSDS